ncbi:MAG TPA: bis(5'-nucleosyl)-tetraphosphatase (symmetrical) YqeK [Candidatus Acutalibacter pullicola]|uniref:bis(5'-nucleosyl)-tetraphosphatase (symmetrical) n=1 Tax=Candidatus Acutalibacter pullicola TaxID=2838417 RepID=A0A9D2MV36_9FIRM|nr:bis(5'-nucleosyl)-tetraphosphatase (symmetrical) YqeK [Candidatus Acutalibacter pullicola]
MTYEQYEQEVQRHLTEKRFYHSQCVAQEAARLAQQYGADVEKARLAGILHDIMKDTPPEQQLKILQDSGILLTKTQRHNRKLWHALAGAAYLQQTLQVKDGDIVEAVRCHTSGKKDMSLLEKVLFVADYISADREYPGVERMRQAAYRSLEEAIVEGVLFTVQELMGQRLPVAAESVEAYNDALLILEDRGE